MYIRIFQLKNANAYKSPSLDYESIMSNGGIDASLYKQIYYGDINIQDTDIDKALNKVYKKCTSDDKPLGYNGGYISIGDIIEICENKSFYYVDTFGYKKIEEFDIGFTNHNDMVRILICETDNTPYISEIPADDIKVMQHIVGGHFETFPFKDGIIGWCNEDGIALGLPINRNIQASIYGTVFFTSLERKNGEMVIAGLSDEQMKMLCMAFNIV